MEHVGSSQYLSGHSLERRLKQLQELVQAKEEEVADLRLEIKQLEERIAKKAVSHDARAPAS